jgi:hypothetical protein
MFYIQYEVRPLPQHDDYAEVGGAYANCFVLTDSAAQAEACALRNFAENHWEVVSLEEGARPSARSDFTDGAWLEWFDQATHEGECFVFFQWPNEAQDHDPLH